MRKNLTLLLICLVVLSGCAGSRHLTGTTWFNISTVTEEGVSGDVLSGIEFKNENKVEMQMSAVVDTLVAVSPMRVADGEYSYNEKDVVKKNQPISFSVTNLGGETADYSGLFINKREMELIHKTDSIRYQKLTKKSLRKTTRK